MVKEVQTGNKSVEQLRYEFCAAPPDALLNRRTVAAGIGFSLGWLELKAVTGGGIPFLKLGRRCLYKKAEVLEWIMLNGKKVSSTSEYTHE